MLRIRLSRDGALWFLTKLFVAIAAVVALALPILGAVIIAQEIKKLIHY